MELGFTSPAILANIVSTGLMANIMMLISSVHCESLQNINIKVDFMSFLSHIIRALINTS